MAKLYFANVQGKPDRSGVVEFVNYIDDQMNARVSGVLHDLQKVVKNWEGTAVVAHHHTETNSWILIAMHDLTLGPAAGGTRIKCYETPIDGFKDAIGLAQAMTSKWAIVKSPWGGGKAVLALTRELNLPERRELLTVYATVLNALDGAFSTAGDLGTSAEDLSFLAKLSEFVTDGDQSHGETVDSGTYTALGLRAAMRACLAHNFGNAYLKGRSVLVQGLGQVGGMLARLLVLDGARVSVNDLDLELAARFEKEIVCRVVASQSVYETVCDVYAPCGAGGTLNEQTLEQLSCHIVCGGANNQLASIEVADQLHRRGILYAPDYVVNAGGAIGLTMFGQGVPDDQIYARIESIEASVATILNHAAERSISPARAADDQVRNVLAEARAHNLPYEFRPLLTALAQSP